MMRFFLYLILGALAAAPAWAGLRIYATPLAEASWSFSGTALVCRLSHNIAGYGTAQFVQKTDGPLSFHVQVNEAAASPGDARLISMPATWQHYDKPRDLGSLPIVPGKTPFYLDEPGARGILGALEEGLIPTLIYRDWDNQEETVRVRISPLGFARVIGDFRACVEGLLPYTLADVRQTVFLYDVNQTSLSESQRDRLSQVSRYVAQDKRIKQVRIEGYTDSKGLRRVNLKVANRRIAAVKDYLVDQGVPGELIVTRAYDETEGPFDNRTEEGRRKNRRVEVTLQL